MSELRWWSSHDELVAFLRSKTVAEMWEYRDRVREEYRENLRAGLAGLPSDRQWAFAVWCLKNTPLRTALRSGGFGNLPALDFVTVWWDENRAVLELAMQALESGRTDAELYAEVERLRDMKSGSRGASALWALATLLNPLSSHDVEALAYVCSTIAEIAGAPEDSRQKPELIADLMTAQAAQLEALRGWQ